MNRIEEIELIKNEVKDPSKPEVNHEKKSWWRKWLDRSYRIVQIWTAFAIAVMIAQIILFYIGSDKPIPGSTAIYTSAGILAAAWIGGDQIVDRISKR